MSYLNQKIVVPSDNTLKFLRLEDIVRIEAQGSYAVIYLRNNEKICSCKNIGHFKGPMWEFGFFKTHKSHIINTDYINSYHKEGSVTMTDGSRVPVSRRRKEAFKSEVLEPYYPNTANTYQARLIKLSQSKINNRVESH